MALTNLPVEDIEALAFNLSTQANQLEAQLNALRTSAQRDPNFTGPAANAYDEFLDRWSTNQAGMLENIRGASGLLQSFANQLKENDKLVADKFGY